VVQNLPNSGRDFTQMLAQTTVFAGLSTGGAGMASVNGTRSNSVKLADRGNRQQRSVVEYSGREPGGVSALAGVILPIDAMTTFRL